jgi:hypothetical protein
MPRIKKLIRRFSKKTSVKCIRCNILFPNVNTLKAHNRTHLQKMKEMRMLEEGAVPKETKIGSSFRGKNRVVIA